MLLMLPLFAQAQKHHEIGLFAGVSNYYGDLQDKLFPSYGYKPNVGVIYKYFMHPRVGLRLGANYTRLTAADSLSDIPVKRARNLRFETGLFEVHGGIEINLFAVDIDRAKVSPYIFAGIGVFYYNPYTDGMNGEKVYLRPLSTEGQGIPTYPDRKQYVPYEEHFTETQKNKLYHGASPVAMVKMARHKGYRLVGANNYGFNFIFIKNGIAEDLLPEVSVETVLKHPSVSAAQKDFNEIKDWKYERERYS